MQKKPRKISIFIRLIIVFSITILSIYLVMVYLFVRNINQSSSALIESRRTQAQTYMDNLEKQMDTIYMQEINLINETGGRKLAYSVYEDDYEKTTLILELKQTLDNIKSLNPLIDNISITFPEQSIVILTQKGYELRPYIEEQKTKSDGEHNYLLTDDGNIELRFTYPLMYSVNENYIPDYIISIVISNDEIQSTLGIFSDDLGSSAALLFDNGDVQVVGDEKKDIVSAWNKNNHESLIETVKIDGSNYQFEAVVGSKYPMTLLLYTNKRILQQIVIRNIIFLTIVTVVLSSLFFISLIYAQKLIVKPLHEMMEAFKQLQNGRLEVQIHHKPNDEFNYLYHGFNDMVTKIRILIDNISEQENLLQKAELAQLQSQINPHFLYNSFFIINRMAKNENYELITQFVTSLAKYYRFINKEQSNLIPLVTEIEHMKNYNDIQQMRFGDKIIVEIAELPEAIYRIEIPKLILQPLLENAYEYGVVNKLRDGLIRISYAYEGRTIKIIIEDNGDEVDDALIHQIRERLSSDHEQEKSHALYNINRRLQLAYGESSGLKIEKSILGGIKVVICINSEK